MNRKVTIYFEEGTGDLLVKFTDPEIDDEFIFRNHDNIEYGTITRAVYQFAGDAPYFIDGDIFALPENETALQIEWVN